MGDFVDVASGRIPLSISALPNNPSRSIEVEEIGEPRTIFRMSASGGGSRTTPTYNIPQELQVGEWIVLAARPEDLPGRFYCGK